MLVDGFLAFLDGTVVLSLTDVAALLVADHIERDELRIIVLVALLFLEVSLDKGLRAIKISIVAGIEGVPPA